MRNLKKMIIFCIFLLVCLQKTSFAQLSVSYYASSLSKMGVAFQSGRLWSELRLYSNTFFEDITPELIVCYNIVSTQKHNLYLGIGGNVNYFTGVVLPLGVQFRPFERLHHFSLHIELQPTLDFNREDVILQSSWGIRYTFGRRNDD